MIALGGGVTLAAVLNCLHKSGIAAYAVAPTGDFVRHSRWYRPLPGNGAEPRPENLKDVLRSLPIERAVLLPCSDDWLSAVTALPAWLSARFPSSTAGACVDVLADKWRFAQLLDSLSLPHPRTHLLASNQQFHSLPESAFSGAILKPLSSVEFAARHGVKGYLVESYADAQEVLRQLDLPIMLQEFIPGPPTAGYFLDGFRDREGVICAMFARRRERMFPAKLGNSTALTSVPLSELEGAVGDLESLLEKIRYRGIFSAEFKRDARDGLFKLIEINARPWWYVEFASVCGVDVCSMAYEDALGMPIVPVKEYKIGRRCVFVINDLRAWRGQRRVDQTSCWSLLRAWIRSDSTPFHWSDPGPAFYCLRANVIEFLRAKLTPLFHRRRQTAVQPHTH
jgi:D-aspartate ligase